MTEMTTWSPGRSSSLPRQLAAMLSDSLALRVNTTSRGSGAPMSRATLTRASSMSWVACTESS